VKVVQARLGHASATTTLDVYGHLFPDEEHRTRTAIDAVFDGSTDDVQAHMAPSRATSRLA
jgi:integrase